MKFKFNLEKVLQHRKIIENLAKVDFQSAVAALRIEENVLQEMLNSIVQSRETSFKIQTQSPDIGLVLSPEAGPPQLQNIQQFIRLQGFRVENQKAKIQKCINLVEEKREILRTRASERKILERLREKRKAEFVQDANYQEQLEADEMSLMRIHLKEQK